MIRRACTPRKDWQRKVEKAGLTYHTRSGPYWDESAHYLLTDVEVDELEAAGNTLHGMFMEAAEFIIKHDRFADLHLSKFSADLIKEAWEADQWEAYGRFDFLYDGSSPPKLLEYNADTPTGLVEASSAQWYWLQDMYPELDQFNSIHEALIDRWKTLREENKLGDKLYFSCLRDFEEDVMTVAYLADTAAQAGLDAPFIAIEDIGWNEERGCLTDMAEKWIPALFKLYPWENMVDEEFADCLPGSTTRFIEPAWKMLWANKAILPILWEMFPKHTLLLPASTNPYAFDKSFVKKPVFGREGQNVVILDDNGQTQATEGHYGDGPFVYQQYYQIQDFNGMHPVCGIWMIGNECRGLGIREDAKLITGNLSRFVPHAFQLSTRT